MKSEIYSKEILKNHTLIPANIFLACDKCLYVDANSYPDLLGVCPNCGKKYRRRLYQSYSIQYFLELIQRLYIKDEPQAIVLIVCAMLERLLEDLLFQIMRKNKLNDNEIEDKLQKLWRLDDRAEKLFKEFTNLTLSQSISNIPNKDFWTIWKDIKKKRDQFMHGKPSVIKSSDGKKAFELALNAQYIFSQIHNKYALLN